MNFALSYICSSENDTDKWSMPLGCTVMSLPVPLLFNQVCHTHNLLCLMAKQKYTVHVVLLIIIWNKHLSENKWKYRDAIS